MRSQSWLVLPDVHSPFHSRKLMAKVLAVIVDLRPQGLVIAGDFLDLYSLATYHADSVAKLQGISLKGEYAAGARLLDALDDALPAGCAKHYLFGNHEDRYFRELQRGDRGKYGAALQSPTEALRLRERGYQVHENWMDDSVKIGTHLEVVHGLYCTKYAAARHLEEFQGSVMFGHTHRVQTHVLGRRAAYNIGCLCDIDSKGFKYEPRTRRLKWSNGFAIVRLDSRGFYHVELAAVYGGRFTACGTMY